MATQQPKTKSKSLTRADFTDWLRSIFPYSKKLKMNLYIKHTLFCYCNNSDGKQDLYSLLRLDVELLSSLRNNEITGTAQTKLYVWTGSLALPLATLSVSEPVMTRAVCVCGIDRHGGYFGFSLGCRLYCIGRKLRGCGKLAVREIIIEGSSNLRLRNSQVGGRALLGIWSGRPFHHTH